jgi:RNA polymerase-interacting CarD/CdnL/TRCF family regulator
MMFIKYFYLHQSHVKWRDIITVSQGDRIHHPHHGLGKVQSINSRSFSGEKAERFAEIYFNREGITLMLQENSLDSTIRAPIGPLMAKKLLVHMKNWQAKVSNQSKARANTHQAMLDGDDPQACAEVYKGLRVLEQADALSTSDRRQLKHCAKFLSEELANALGQTEREALDLMTQATRI